MYICHINLKNMYTLSEANLKEIAAHFAPDVPSINGVSIIDLITAMSANNVILTQSATVEAPIETPIVDITAE
jgi:hypothetical protein